MLLQLGVISKPMLLLNYQNLWVVFIAVVLAFPRGLAGLFTDLVLPRIKRMKSGETGASGQVRPAPAE
jgi:hypothetical protein